MLLVFVASATSAWAEITWFGTVVDIRTQAPIAGARVCAGAEGRVDIVCTDSGADGGFSVSYPKDIELWSPPYLFIEPTDNNYFNQVRMREGAGQVLAEIVPWVFFIRGVVLDAETGLPVANASVELCRPGAIDETVYTDSAGEFAFGPVRAYTASRKQFNTFGVPADELPPDHDEALVGYPWGVIVQAQGYARVGSKAEGEDMVPFMPRISSASDDIYTRVEIRLPKAGQPVDLSQALRFFPQDEQ